MPSYNRLMNILFIRHGESEANRAKVLSSRIEEPYDLTSKGVAQIKEASRSLSGNRFSAIYSSPLVRAVHSAKLIKQQCQIDGDLIIDNRVAEIDYGEYSGKPNNQVLDQVRLRQINGDYEIKFGTYGENKRQILIRLCDFIIDVIKRHQDDENIIVVSHGTVIALVEGFINNTKKIKAEHLHVSNADIKKFVLSSDDLLLFRKLEKDLIKPMG